MKMRSNQPTKYAGPQPRDGSNEINAVSSCSSSSSSSSSLASFHEIDRTCAEPSMLSSSIEGLGDDIDFHFELFEIDSFMEEEADANGMIDASNFFLGDDADTSASTRPSYVRRRSILAVMSHISPPTRFTEQSKEEVPVEGAMEKLDECMRRTADSRAQLLRLIDDRYIDHDEAGNLDDSSMIICPRRVSISLQCEETIQKSKTQPRILKDGRRAIKGKNTTTKGRRKNTSSSEYACSGVLLKRLEPSVTESMISHLSVPTSLGCSGAASKTRIHQILNQKKRLLAGRGGIMSVSVNSCYLGSGRESCNIASFLRQRKNIPFTC